MSEDKITLKIDSIDRLTEHWIAEGESIATERIINLLENEIDAGFDDETLHYLIELIKGETNE